MAQRIRIGVDTGGTFTDVVAVDESTGFRVTTKTPSTPQDPADGFMTGVRRALELLDLSPAAIGSVAHGTTVATNHLLEDRLGRLGFVTTEGYEFLLEIARQSVPDGYGNSYFWVKPDRIVPLPPRAGRVGGRLDHTGAEVRPFDRGRGGPGGALVPRRGDRHDRRLLPALLRPNPVARAGDAGHPRRTSTPTAVGVGVQLPTCCGSTASTSGR